MAYHVTDLLEELKSKYVIGQTETDKKFRAKIDKTVQMINEQGEDIHQTMIAR